ncbi:SMI1/KNR4 family protein [Chitinibacter sp. SCUT-21]|uniref:SMI1/KNR4 family protein n=1 Tax=Chitinibacter sp. SCUT-21 TaxID=2970891 RepID=UPI0035A5C862
MRLFPANAIAIASNGCGDQLVFIRTAHAFNPAVYLWSHESGELSKVADDFAQLSTC